MNEVRQAPVRTRAVVWNPPCSINVPVTVIAVGGIGAERRISRSEQGMEG